MREIAFALNAWEEYLSWQNEDKKTAKKINSLLKSISRTPFAGEGFPEPLKGDKSGKWSRKINDKDRLVYSVSHKTITVYQCRGHYAYKCFKMLSDYNKKSLDFSRLFILARNNC